MSKYTRVTKFETEFEGDKVTVTCRRMTRAHMLRLVSKGSMNAETGQFVASIKEDEMLELMEGINRDCITSIDGLTDAEGAPVDAETVLTEAYFQVLSMEIFKHISEAVKVSKADEKNSDAPQGAA